MREKLEGQCWGEYAVYLYHACRGCWETFDVARCQYTGWDKATAEMLFDAIEEAIDREQEGL